jgi:predicted dehydrogenase
MDRSRRDGGLGGCIGDIGTHAYQLADYVTGIAVTEVLAELTAFVPGRRLDDNAHVMLRYANGARGTLWSSQVAPGNENNLRLRVYGSKGGLEWRQELPNQLYWSPFGQATQIIARGAGAAGADAARVTRIPSGHPEGYLEAFATLYSEIGHAIRSRRAKAPKLDKAVQFPTVVDGVKGVAFVEAVVSSSAKGGKWVKLS